MAYLKFARGLYNKYTPDGLDRDKIYFSTDTKLILVNGISYGVSLDDISSLVNLVEGSFKSVEYTSPNILTFTTNNGVIKTVTLVEATQTSAGLMSLTDKLALDDATSKLAKIGVVEDILTSTSTANALSANMGNQLNTTKLNKIPVVNLTSTTVTILPNTYNLWNSPVTSLNISLGLITETSYVNEFLFEFTAATGFTGLTLPSTVYYSGNTAVKAGGSYLVSILNNVAIIAGVV